MEITPSNPLVVMHGAYALAKMGTREASQALSDLVLHAPNETARLAAIHEIGRFHIAESLPALKEALSHQNRKIRIATLHALAMIGGTEMIQVIEASLNDPDARVRNVAEEIYQKLLAGRDTKPRQDREKQE